MSEQTGAQQGRPMSYDDILQNARELAPWLRQRSPAIEQARRLPEDVVARLREAGMFRLNMPRLWGGPELTSMQQVEVIEILSRGDASAGWCTMIGCDSGLYSGYLDDAVAREMYPRLDMVQAGWVYPVGQAERVKGGYKVTGSWMFGSGCTHTDWLAAGCIVIEDGSMVMQDGFPLWRIMIARPSEYEILDTWHTTGLCGSGSNDYRCADVYVPEEHSFSFREPARREGLLWLRPDTLLRKMPGIPLGIARDAIDTVSALVAEKIEMPSFKPYRDLPRVQAAIAEAETLYGSARAYVFDSLATQWERLRAGSEPSRAERANVWLARTNSFQSARRVVQSMYDTIGGSAIYTRKSPLDRHLRDIQTICQHLVGQTKGWEMVGAMLLGAEAGPPNPFL